MEFLGFTLDTIGKVMVAFTVIMVHRRVWKEHKIGAAVFKSIRKEQIIGVTGIIFIIIGYFLQIPGKM